MLEQNEPEVNRKRLSRQALTVILKEWKWNKIGTFQRKEKSLIHFSKNQTFNIHLENFYTDNTKRL